MIKQLKIKLQNEPGILKNCVSTLSDNGIDIKALEVSERGVGDHGEVLLIVSNLKKATAALKQAGFTIEVEDVLAVEMDDRVGGLSTILDILGKHQINIRNLYAFVSRIEGKSLAVINVGDVAVAEKELEAGGLKNISQEKLEEGESDRFADRPSLADHFGENFIW
jgi:hypothetical protein